MGRMPSEPEKLKLLRMAGRRVKEISKRHTVG
jgi:hypothetical protein